MSIDPKSRNPTAPGRYKINSLGSECGKVNKYDNYKTYESRNPTAPKDNWRPLASMLTQNHCFSNGKQGSASKSDANTPNLLRGRRCLGPGVAKANGKTIADYWPGFITLCPRGGELKTPCGVHIAAPRFGVGGLLICLRTWNE